MLAEVHARTVDIESARAAIDMLSAAPRGTNIDDLDASTMRLEAAELRAEISALEPLIAVENALASRLAKLASLRYGVEQLTAVRHVLAESVAAAPDRMRALRSELDEASTRAARVEALTGKIAHLSARADAWAALPLLTSGLERAAAEALTAGTTANDARESYLRALEIRLQGMAGELATRLRDGVPCAVCGATEHPEPALPAKDAVDEQALRSLDVASHAALATLELSRARATEASVSLARAREVAGDTDPAPHLVALRAELDLAEGAAESLAALAEAVSGADALAEAERRRLGELDVEIATSQVQLTSFSDEVLKQEQLVQASRGQHRSVADFRERQLERAAGVESLAEAVLVLRTAEVGEASVRRLSDLAAREAGFQGSADAALAVLDSTVLQRISDEVATHQRAVTLVSEELGRPEVAGADVVSPDLAPVLADLDEAERARAASVIAAEDARRRVDSVRRRRDDLRRAETLTSEVRAETRPVVRVADAVTGQASVNPRRITLSTYVLRERFASVVQAASHRLERMSSGRYVLEPDEATRGQGKAGLGLVVLDQWTSVRRDTATLSGGESFYASLALALGLADVVRDEVGGVELETLFIDEGFGTLDPDTLESVLDVIDSLRDGGRVVGIVSHVEDLKDRVRDRIEVRALADGTSSARIRT